MITGEEILPSNQILVMEQTKFMCSPLGKTNKNRFGKTNKINWRSRKKTNKSKWKILIMHWLKKDDYFS